MKNEKMMAIALQIEEAAFTAISLYFLFKYNSGIATWALIPLFFSPDISMLGYLINTRIGAYTYNLFHHRAIAIAFVAVGFLMSVPLMATIGIILFAHSSFDRMLGYGLKYTDNFKHTNLGFMGKETAKAI